MPNPRTRSLACLHPGPRVMHGANMLLEIQRWIQATFPKVWERRRGRDHIWLMPHDEGVRPPVRDWLPGRQAC
jgi:hypothetical protein